MTDSLAGVSGFAGVVLAAGAGTRLRPLTDRLPKALCPVANVALVDGAVERVRSVTADVAVNVHHGRAAMEAHLAGRVHLSVEEAQALGTAGAIGALHDWIAGRPSVIVNADAWCPGGMEALVSGWDGERVRVLVPGGGPLDGRSLIAGSLLPWALARELPAEPCGLYEAVWRAAVADDRLETVAHHGPFVDCGTPAAYLAANLEASGGASVVAPGARVEGRLVRSVCWEDAVVPEAETLVDAIRYAERATVLIR